MGRNQIMVAISANHAHRQPNVDSISTLIKNPRKKQMGLQKAISQDRRITIVSQQFTRSIGLKIHWCF